METVKIMAFQTMINPEHRSESFFAGNYLSFRTDIKYPSISYIFAQLPTDNSDQPTRRGSMSVFFIFFLVHCLVICVLLTVAPPK